jgi:hypothetical protein
MKCCICGTVRDCGVFLEKIFQNMDIIGSLFEDYAIILYYDVSSDDTLSKIQEYQGRSNKVNVYINEEPLLPYRTWRIAKGRNKCLDIIREKYSDYDFFIMMDCDDRCAKDMNLYLLEGYVKRNDWDGLSFNHPDGYYDTWAFSKIPFVLSCHHFSDRAQGQRFINHLIQTTPKNELIPCISAFNGFAIYRTNKFLNSNYDGRFRIDYISKKIIQLNLQYSGKINFIKNTQDNKRMEDCEHRYFHFNAVAKNNARMRIAPICLFK